MFWYDRPEFIKEKKNSIWKAIQIYMDDNRVAMEKLVSISFRHVVRGMTGFVGAMTNTEITDTLTTDFLEAGRSICTPVRVITS